MKLCEKNSVYLFLTFLFTINQCDNSNENSNQKKTFTQTVETFKNKTKKLQFSTSFASAQNDKKNYLIVNTINDTYSLNKTNFESLIDDQEDNIDFLNDFNISDFNKEKKNDLNDNQLTKLLIDVEQKRPDDVINVISSAFINKKTFACPKIKSDYITGTSTANLTPEDIRIIAAMGDSLATGTGLWPQTNIEFRGAAFPIGGDASIDGLVTIPNILREFLNSDIYGVSHGMGFVNQLPENQLNVATSGASSLSMPQQAKELVRRLNNLKNIDVYNMWTMVIITIGTEEVCKNCTKPNINALILSLDILNQGINKAFVILLGPIHVSFAYQQKANLLKNRCECLQKNSNEFMLNLSKEWSNGFRKIEKHINSVKRKTFTVLALPMLTITSRYPSSLFLPKQPLLNRRGHTYATKFLWNRLIAGEKYNLSKAMLSQDAYYCPSLACPYFRTAENLNHCEILSYAKANKNKKNAFLTNGGFQSKFNVYIDAIIIILITTATTFVFGAIFYYRSKKGTKGRFDELPLDLEINNRTNKNAFCSQKKEREKEVLNKYLNKNQQLVPLMIL